MHTLKRITSTMAALGAAIVACLPIRQAGAQWSFTVDPTFQTTIVQQNVNDMVILEDGKIFISGRIRFPGDLSDRGSAKLLNNGDHDVVFPTFPQTTGGGKITPWYGMYYVSNGLVRRLTGEGLIDASYISMNLGPYFNSLQGGDYHVFPDGRVLITGNHQLNDSIRGFVGRYQLVWFSNTGYLDTTRTHRSGGNCAVYRFAELPNGQFICSGLCDQFDGQEIDRIFRVHADGSVDTTFRTGVYIGAAYDYLPMEDGRVYVGGNFRRTAAPEDTLKLVRFLIDGELDPSFNIPYFGLGGLSGPFGPVISKVYPWFGHLLVTGFFGTVNGEPRRGICLLDTTGAVLPAFASSGVGPYTFGSVTYASIESVAYDTTNAQLYVCGAYSGYDDGLNNYPEQRFITRLNVQELSVGVQEQTPPQATLQLWPNPSNQQTWLAYSLPGHSGPVQLRIRDAQGRVAHTLQASGEEGQVVWDTRSIAPGVYTVELLSARLPDGQEGKLERTERLVIQP